MRALLDTNVLIALLKTGETRPDLNGFTGLMISSLSFSELHMGVATAGTDSATRTAREDRISRIRATFGAGIPYDDRCALAFQVISEEVLRNGGSPKTWSHNSVAWRSRRRLMSVTASRSKGSSVAAVRS